MSTLYGTNFNDTTPAAPSSGTNVKWQSDSSGNASAYVPQLGPGSVIAGVNNQTVTSYTIAAGDLGKLLTISNAAAVAVTLPQAGSTGFAAGFFLWVENRGAGTVTITPTTSTVDGAVSLALSQNQGVLIVSDGTNYFTSRGIGTTFANQNANTVFAGPSSGSAAAPAFRALVPADLFSGVNAQAGTSYTIADSDQGKLVTISNAAAVAVTLPQAGTGAKVAGYFFWIENRGAGTATITPTTSTIDGGASISLTQNQGCLIVSDGTNYYTMRGMGSGGGATYPASGQNIALFPRLNDGDTGGTGNATANITYYVKIPYQQLMALATGKTVQFAIQAGSTSLTVTNVFIKRTNNGTTTVTDVTQLMISGSASATISANAIQWTDAVSLDIDSSHDYWLGFYVATGASNTGVSYASYKANLPKQFTSAGDQHTSTTDLATATGDLSFQRAFAGFRFA